MPKGPCGEKRPADTIGAAITVAKIATGEISEAESKAPGRRKSGRAGAKARAEKLGPKGRKAVAKKAAEARWSKERRRAMTQNQCNALAERFDSMAEKGLVDVKFYVRNLEEAVTEKVCREVNRLYEALDQGEYAPLDFKDSQR